MIFLQCLPSYGDLDNQSLFTRVHFRDVVLLQRPGSFFSRLIGSWIHWSLFFCSHRGDACRRVLVYYRESTFAAPFYNVFSKQIHSFYDACPQHESFLNIVYSKYGTVSTFYSTHIYQSTIFVAILSSGFHFKWLYLTYISTSQVPTFISVKIARLHTSEIEFLLIIEHRDFSTIINDDKYSTWFFLNFA